MNISYNLSTPDGRDASALASVIALRAKELGETTRQACVAVASNVLRSLRAQTKVARENQMEVTVKLADDKYWPSFKRERGSKGKNVSKRVLRQGPDGPVVTPEKVVWRLGNYVKGQVAHSFEVEDRVSKDKVVQYIMVASSEKDALRHARLFHKNRVKAHKSLAKYAVTVAMKAVYDKGAAGHPANQAVKKIAEQNVEAFVQETGFSSGTVRVHVHDKLDYAVPALKDGQASVKAAVLNALRKTFGYVKSRVKANGGDIDKSLHTEIDSMLDKGAE